METTTTAATASKHQDADIASRIQVGITRIRDGDGFLGTVVYLGPVASAKNGTEIYAGIVWDDPTRGKHDGSVICRRTNALIRHFAAPPNGGSFLRLRKLDFGVPLTHQLIQDRYVAMDAPLLAPNNLLPHTARTSSGKPKDIELVGELKIRKKQQMELLPRISLRSLGISSCARGPLTDTGTVAHIQDVDLAGNLLTDWETVWDIIDTFPLLQSLSLAANKLHDMGPVPTNVSIRPAYHRIHTINLHDCAITQAATLEAIDLNMPNLKELCLASNNLCFLATRTTGLSGFAQLTSFDASNCQLTDWRSFATLPLLETLHLDGNPMLTLEPVQGFPTLTTLSLSGTAMRTWQELDVLLPFGIKALKLRMTPLTSTMGAAEARYLTISRLPALEMLNSTWISLKERTDAERRYVHYVARELVWKEPTEVWRDHPQYRGLLEQHPDWHHDSSSDARHPSMATHAINVTIRSMAAASCSMEALHKRLPSTITVGRVKALCARAFGLDADLQILHVMENGAAFPTPLDDDEHTLAYFGVTDGSDILMNEVDLEAQQREEQKRLDLHERMMKEQEDEIIRRKEHMRKQQA